MTGREIAALMALVRELSNAFSSLPTSQSVVQQ